MPSLIFMKKSRALLFAGALLATSAAVNANSFVDPLDLPVAAVHRADQKPMRDIAKAGKRLVAVGDNGIIIFSDDQGTSWAQAKVPVSVDLNSVYFADDQHGWAIGHGAVILRSLDAGANWTKQLDGRGLEAIVVDYFKSKSGLDEQSAENYLTAILNMTRPGPGQFFMGVWFDTRGNGFAVGPFGLIMASQDSGETWQPWNMKIDNNDLFHLTSIREVEGTLFITGERGRVWRQDPVTKSFVAIETGYQGTLFGFAGDKGNLLAFGLKGHVFRSIDGAQTWTAVGSDFKGSVTAGAALEGRGFVLVNQSAQVAISRNGGSTFKPLDVKHASLFTGVVGLTADRLALVGLNGVTIMQTP
ncbi:WD40/YVTN/BNR-like repeat-containing protein [Pseudomonas simiae]|uniref:WD40/YVTN/BNR-like repeat-containing protein n=1 Tax=Pseudomonas simiae TaxID=321846 RepID=UPI003D6B3333